MTDELRHRRQLKCARRGHPDFDQNGACITCGLVVLQPKKELAR